MFLIVAPYKRLSYPQELVFDRRLVLARMKSILESRPSLELMLCLDCFVSSVLVLNVENGVLSPYSQAASKLRP